MLEKWQNLTLHENKVSAAESGRNMFVFKEKMTHFCSVVIFVYYMQHNSQHKSACVAQRLEVAVVTFLEMHFMLWHELLLQACGTHMCTISVQNRKNKIDKIGSLLTNGRMQIISLDNDK